MTEQEAWFEDDFLTDQEYWLDYQRVVATFNGDQTKIAKFQEEWRACFADDVDDCNDELESLLAIYSCKEVIRLITNNESNLQTQADAIQKFEEAYEDCETTEEIEQLCSIWRKMFKSKS